MEETIQADTKNRILDVAERLFAEKGFDSTGIDQISREVGIAKSVIYYHYKNKDALFEAVFERARRLLIQTKATAGESVLRSRSEIMIGVFQAFHEQETFDRFKPIFRIMLMEAIKPSPRDPLFDLWDDNINYVLEHWSDFLNPKMTEDPLQFRLETFFFFFMPVVSLLVFEDSWAKRYSLSKLDVRKRGMDALTDMFREYILPRVWGDGIHRLRESLKNPEQS